MQHAPPELSMPPLPCLGMDTPPSPPPSLSATYLVSIFLPERESRDIAGDLAERTFFCWFAVVLFPVPTPSRLS